MLTQQKKTKRIDIKAVRPFQIVKRDSEGEITGHDVVKTGARLNVEESFGREMIAAGKAERSEGAEDKSKAGADKG